MMQFRTAVLIAALFAVCPTAAPAQTPPPAEGWNAAARGQTINAAEKALDGYFFTDRIAKLKAAIEAQRATLLAISNPEKFADAFTKVLYGVAHDKHLGVWYSADVLPPLTRSKPSATETARRQHMDSFMDYGYSSSARLPGNIGYLRLAFFPPPPGSFKMYDTTMSLLDNTDALIIDLRDNGGGSPESVDYLLGYFFAKPVEITGFLLRHGNTVERQREYTPATLGGARYLDKPVYLLINDNTISGGEQFAYDLKTLHRAVLVGETTAGGANPGGPVRLNDHFSIFIPDGSARNPYTGTNWEGTGVAPDIAVHPAKALLAAYKLALKAAKDSFRPAGEDREMALSDPARALRMVLPKI